jgi:hypothetical protein
VVDEYNSETDKKHNIWNEPQNRDYSIKDEYCYKSMRNTRWMTGRRKSGREAMCWFQQFTSMVEMPNPSYTSSSSGTKTILDERRTCEALERTSMMACRPPHRKGGGIM